MNRFTFLLLPLLLSACSDPEAFAPVEIDATPPTTANEEQPQDLPEKMTVTGILEHFPQDVKSVKSWSGHEFKVGDTPIKPTDEVSAEDLKQQIGSTVTIQGVWNPGIVVKPTGEALFEQRPLGYEEQPRGDGLEASSISKSD